MNQIDKKVYLKEILLDKNNPRFGENFNHSQEEIKDKLLSGMKSNELLTSMCSGLVWVNKIVLAPIEDLSLKEKALYSPIPPQKKYVVIEGNTRVACLLHSETNKVFNKSKPFPVIIVKKSPNESDIEYLKERKRLQSIANVMVVKDWDEVPKAKQLYESYKLAKEINPTKSEQIIFRELGNDIGLSLSKVKGNICKYIFLEELNNSVSLMDKSDFKYLEVFESSNEVRNLFGYSSSIGKFIWDINEPKSDQQLEDEENRKELLNLYPMIITIAKQEGINSKKLRDLIRKYKSDDISNLLQTFKDIIRYSDTEDYTSDAIKNYLCCEIDNFDTDKEDLRNNLNKAIKFLKNFPIYQDYSIEFKNEILNIHDIISKILKDLN